MSRGRSLSEEERALWTGVARSIMPLQRARPAAEASDECDPGAASPKEAPAVARPPVRPNVPPAKQAPPLAPLGRKLKQRVARGRDPIEARLDLHGYTQKQAHAELLRFLRRAQENGVRVALVVTGKGTRGEGGPGERGVLKRSVPLWLATPEFRALVVGFDDAHVGHGGQGALYVRLRRAR
jgi:DNA-nicking Smr family endonuclease